MQTDNLLNMYFTASYVFNISFLPDSWTELLSSMLLSQDPEGTLPAGWASLVSFHSPKHLEITSTITPIILYGDHLFH